MNPDCSSNSVSETLVDFKSGFAVTILKTFFGVDMISIRLRLEYLLCKYGN